MSVTRVFRPRFRSVVCLRCGKSEGTAYTYNGRITKIHVCEMRFELVALSWGMLQEGEVYRAKDC